MSRSVMQVSDRVEFQIERKSEPISLEVRLGGPESDQQFIKLQPGEWVSAIFEGQVVSVRLKK